jgi:hypothetical protein
MVSRPYSGWAHAGLASTGEATEPVPRYIRAAFKVFSVMWSVTFPVNRLKVYHYGGHLAQIDLNSVVLR